MLCVDSLNCPQTVIEEISYPHMYMNTRMHSIFVLTKRIKFLLLYLLIFCKQITTGYVLPLFCS